MVSKEDRPNLEEIATPDAYGRDRNDRVSYGRFGWGLLFNNEYTLWNLDLAIPTVASGEAISFKLQKHDNMKPNKARASIPNGALIP